ncbi:MAG: hypothetical protein QX194_06650 [Methylococcales bacterium]
MLHGCTDLRYPGWNEVKVERSAANKPCELKGARETCSNSVADCEIWLKKRATLVNANTIVVESSPKVSTAKYYNCQPGLPLYKKLKFTKEGYTQGSNSVIGQGFLTQQGGGVVTCAGKMVSMRPNNAYFLALYNGTQEVEQSDEAATMDKSTQCDATGNFEFDNIQDGEWTIETTVSWNVYRVNNAGPFLYTAKDKQGGIMRKNVTVKSNEKNKFIISE